MSDSISDLARKAGFLSRSDLSRTCASNTQETEQLLGMDVVTSPLMPEGFAAIRTDTGAMVISPSGNTWWVPYCYKSPKGKSDE